MEQFNQFIGQNYPSVKDQIFELWKQLAPIGEKIGISVSSPIPIGNYAVDPKALVIWLNNDSEQTIVRFE
jgi:hypothetical protein